MDKNDVVMKDEEKKKPEEKKAPEEVPADPFYGNIITIIMIITRIEETDGSPRKSS